MITNGHLAHSERLAVGTAHAVLTFGAVNMPVEGIVNRGEATAATTLQGQGDLINVGTLKLQMSSPVWFTRQQP